MSLKDFLKSHQQTLILVIGYILVASLAFGLGRSTAPKQIPVEKEIKVESVPNNYNSNQPAVQSATQTVIPAPGQVNCDGKIKGSSSLVYHLPGGAFYDRTTKPIRCFETEADAQAGGFRKSAR